jgi:hypothetical protein
VIVGSTRMSVTVSRRRALLVSDETLIHLDDEPLPLATAPSSFHPGLDPGLDITGEISRAPTVEHETGGAE